ncbi:LOW QUALITY PROTEIN: potassium channel subfamily K member 17 [Grammomys surdaster]|uniref:LOW QUALITY PROTEIN: potassium channel subfamily K member 17 n=1 Tax=Grammomys surdaster TaxID=491861 RepID=UPI0010A01AEF|nr:LOW QUALITY PROTEIN: potassium channel subfamily K member 17 [Grammomys surdaster]
MWGTGLLLLSVLAYLVLGTGVFWALEGRVSGDLRSSFQRDKWELLQDYMCLDGPALDLLIYGTSLLGNTTSLGSWDFVDSFFFFVSTITIISNGWAGPATHLSCVFFALLGIPFNLVVLNHLGHLMKHGVHRCVHWLEDSWQMRGDPSRARWLTGSAELLLGLLLFLLLPVLLFSHMEGWSCVESFYFIFITLSTVDFGNYMIGMDPSREYPLWYKSIVSLWIILSGMACLV